MTEQKLAEWIISNQAGIDEYDMAYNDTVKVTLQFDGKNVEVERLSCTPIKHVYVKARSGKDFYLFEYANLTEYLQEKISDAVEAATPKE